MTKKGDVNVVLRQVQNVGGRIVKPAQDAFWGGYHGYFSDPDGNFSEVAERIRRSETGEKFRSTAYPWLPEGDLDLCLSLDLFDFVLRCESNMATPCLQRVDIHYGSET